MHNAPDQASTVLWLQGQRGTPRGSEWLLEREKRVSVTLGSWFTGPKAASGMKAEFGQPTMEVCRRWRSKNYGEVEPWLSFGT
jgi:hypothetical protein